MCRLFWCPVRFRFKSFIIDREFFVIIVDVWKEEVQRRVEPGLLELSLVELALVALVTETEV
jgi:hypothetical protein